MSVSLCDWQVTWLLKGSEKEGNARKKLPLTGSSQPKGSEKEGNTTIQLPFPHIRISNTSCSFLAFSKAKNAHMWRGSPKCMEIKVSYVQARRFIDFIH